MNILICGATTYGNKGDDVIRDIMTEHISSLNSEISIKTTRPYPQLELIQWADKVIIGGGGILYDEEGTEHGQSNFDYYINQYLAKSIELGKPVCLCAVGVQGILKEENIERFRDLLRGVSFISVRQDEDKEFFDKNTLFSNIVVADDLGFLTKKAPYTFTAPGKKTKVCLVPSKVPYEQLEWLTKNLLQLEYEVYVTTTSYEDMNIVHKLRELIGENGSLRDYCYLNPSEYVSLFSEMDIVITGRFHGAVFAHAARVENILHISYTSKLLNQFLPEGCIRECIEKQDSETLQERLGLKNLIKCNNNSQIHLDLLTQFINA